MAKGIKLFEYSFPEGDGGKLWLTRLVIPEGVQADIHIGMNAGDPTRIVLYRTRLKDIEMDRRTIAEACGFIDPTGEQAVTVVETDKE